VRQHLSEHLSCNVACVGEHQLTAHVCRSSPRLPQTALVSDSGRAANATRILLMPAVIPQQPMGKRQRRAMQEAAICKTLQVCRASERWGSAAVHRLEGIRVSRLSRMCFPACLHLPCGVCISSCLVCISSCLVCISSCLVCISSCVGSCLHHLRGIKQSAAPWPEVLPLNRLVLALPCLCDETLISFASSCCTKSKCVALAAVAPGHLDAAPQHCRDIRVRPASAACGQPGEEHVHQQQCGGCKPWEPEAGWVRRRRAGWGGLGDHTPSIPLM
jgi:hypothetical protein